MVATDDNSSHWRVKKHSLCDIFFQMHMLREPDWPERSHEPEDETRMDLSCHFWTTFHQWNPKTNGTWDISLKDTQLILSCNGCCSCRPDAWSINWSVDRRTPSKTGEILFSTIYNILQLRMVIPFDRKFPGNSSHWNLHLVRRVRKSGYFSVIMEDKEAQKESSVSDSKACMDTTFHRSCWARVRWWWDMGFAASTSGQAQWKSHQSRWDREPRDVLFDYLLDVLPCASG